MNAPTIYWIGNLVRMAKQLQTSHPTLGYVPARPMGFWGICLRHRIKAAWLVFTGRADVVKWYE